RGGGGRGGVVARRARDEGERQQDADDEPTPRRRRGPTPRRRRGPPARRAPGVRGGPGLHGPIMRERAAGPCGPCDLGHDRGPEVERPEKRLFQWATVCGPSSRTLPSSRRRARL